MKALFITLFSVFYIVFFSAGANAQHLVDVVEVEGKTADVLYDLANEWYSINFKSSDDIIELKDPVEKKLIGKGSKQLKYKVGFMPTFMTLYYTLYVQIKDGRYRYDIEQTEIKSQGHLEYTYEQLQDMATEEGLLEMYVEMGVQAKNVVGKKEFKDHLYQNQLLIASIDKVLPSIIEDFDKALRNESSDDDW